MATSNVTQAVDDMTRTAVETTIQNSHPLADFDEFASADVAADAVLSGPTDETDDSDDHNGDSRQTRLVTDGGVDTINLPAESIAEFVREQCLLDCEIHTVTPDGVDADQWAILNEAEYKDAEYVNEDGEIHVWYTTETRAERKVARATRTQPAEYEVNYLETLVSVCWTLDPTDTPTVDIEVLA